MNKQTSVNGQSDYCGKFHDNLDSWLAGELEENHAIDMQAHLAICDGCRVEYNLAREILQTTQSLPEIDWSPGIILVEGKSFGDLLREYFTPLVQLYRKPALMLPTLLIVSATSILVFQLLTGDAPGNGKLVIADSVIIDGKEYSREEIDAAVSDFILAMDYLNKYTRYTTELVETELTNKKMEKKDANPDKSTDDDAI